MTGDPPSYDDLLLLLEAVAEDAALRTWMLELRTLSSAERATALAEMAERMAAAHEDPAVVAALGALSRDELFQQACQALENLPHD